VTPHTDLDLADRYERRCQRHNLALVVEGEARTAAATHAAIHWARRQSVEGVRRPRYTGEPIIPDPIPSLARVGYPYAGASPGLLTW